MKRKTCYMCGGTNKLLLRYRPVSHNGRWVLCCPDCIAEAQTGKFGSENRLFSYQRTDGFTI